MGYIPLVVAMMAKLLFSQQLVKIIPNFIPAHAFTYTIPCGAMALLILPSDNIVSLDGIPLHGFNDIFNQQQSLKTFYYLLFIIYYLLFIIIYYLLLINNNK